MKSLLFSFSLSFLGIFLSFLLYSHNHGNRAFFCTPPRRLAFYKGKQSATLGYDSVSTSVFRSIIVSDVITTNALEAALAPRTSSNNQCRPSQDLQHFHIVTYS